jgi:hypothetical protein
VNGIKKEYYHAFGMHLHMLLKKYNKDVATVAALGRIESKQVYRVLNGEHGASLGTIIAIAKGLEIHPKELFDFKFNFKEE